VHLAGSELMAVVDPMLRQTVDVLAGVVAAVGLTEPVVLLTGGASRMPQCAELIRERLGVEPVALSGREAVVCLGALTPGLVEPAVDPGEPGSPEPTPAGHAP